MTQEPTRNWLEDCLDRLGSVRVGVFGDFCLDAYWLIDEDGRELSVETGLPVRRVRSQRYSLGGAGNVVANLVALGVKKVHAVGLIGEDLFGRQMLQLLEGLGVDTTGMLRCQEDWQTLAYAKPCVGQEEQNRIDFGAFNVISSRSIRLLAAQADQAARLCDILILNQQVPAGVSTGEMIQELNAVVARHPRCRFIVDSRHRAEFYHQTMLKLNDAEAQRLVTGQAASGVPRRLLEEQASQYARALFERIGQPVFVTRGEHGILAAGESGLESVAGIEIREQTDPVGAGDTVVAALAAALGAGVRALAAARLANLAASVTVRKLQTTGTASPAEVRLVGPEPDYMYQPELADDPRRATYLAGSRIEIVRAGRARAKVLHAIFDHDGTLSTLRQGWERLMEPMMIRAILGPRYDQADEALYHRVADHVRRFIDQTTGHQTLVQMQGLVEMVRQSGCVEPSEVLDMHAYKAIYNHDLLAMVDQRLARLENGNAAPQDFHIRGTMELLEDLHRRGVHLYLVSGTDRQDVMNEAGALGYAHLFEGRIFGAVGDIKIEAKRQVVEQIIDGHHLDGPELVAFGDGPVEIRLTRRHGGLTIGVASDEVARGGLNLVKRSRLIRAGADYIIPDYTEREILMDLLFP